MTRIRTLLKSEAACAKAAGLCVQRKKAFDFDWAEKMTLAKEELI